VTRRIERLGEDEGEGHLKPTRWGVVLLFGWTTADRGQAGYWLADTSAAEGRCVFELHAVR
jgi:hypothetical protein